MKGNKFGFCGLDDTNHFPMLPDLDTVRLVQMAGELWPCQGLIRMDPYKAAAPYEVPPVASFALPL